MSWTAISGKRKMNTRTQRSMNREIQYAEPLDREYLAGALRYAGCPEERVSRMAVLWEQNRRDDLISSLYTYRKEILEEMHRAQNRLGTLDLLLYRIREDTDTRKTR